MSAGYGVKRRRSDPSLALPLLVALILLGAATASRAESTTAAFLKIPVSARALSLGSGIAALADDAGSMAHNPAGLGRLAARELTMLYAPHLQGMTLGYAAYAQPTSLCSVGISYLTLRSGALEGRDESGQAQGGFSAEDRALGVWLGRSFLRAEGDSEGRLRLGAGLKHLSSRIGSYSASGYAVDLGAQAPLSLGRVPLALGMSARNLGPGMRFVERREALPGSVSAGLAARPLGAWVVAAGATQWLREGRMEWTAGTEFAAGRWVSFRGTYRLARAGGGGLVESSLAGGVGIIAKNLRLDYAIVPMGAWGATQRMSVTLRFGSPEGWAARDEAGSEAASRNRAAGDYQWNWRQPWTY